MKSLVRTLVAIAALGAAACGQQAAPGAPTGDAETSRPSRTLVLVAQAEPVSMAAKSIRDTGGRRIGATLRLFNAGLAILDERQVAHPYLTDALPSLGTDSWRLLPDGRMETVYRLKPNLTWQDGAPLLAEDFVFAQRVYATPEFGVANIGAMAYVEDVTAGGPQAVVFHWRQPFAGAG